MKKKVLAMFVSLTLIAALTACGSDTVSDSAADEESVMPETETVESDESAETMAFHASVSRAEWSLDDITALSDLVTGITDREYAAGEGANYVIYEDITYDRDIVYTVLFNTGAVRFDTPGVYDMTYWVYFDASALGEYISEMDVSLSIPDADRLAVTVYATVTVTEAEDEEVVDDEGVDGTEAASASGSSGTSSSKGSSSSNATSSSASQSRSSGSSSSSSSQPKSGPGHTVHTWVWVTEEQNIYEGRYICNNCGFSTLIGSEIAGHTATCGGGCGYHAGRVVVGTQTVSVERCADCGLRRDGGSN